MNHPVDELRRARRAAGFRSAADFAKQLDIDVQAYADLEQGKTNDCLLLLTAADVKAIAYYLDCSCDTVLNNH